MALTQQNGECCPYGEEEEHQQNPPFPLESLYCEEEKFEEEEKEEEVNQEKSRLSPLLMLKQDMLWEDGELISLFSKEEEQQQKKQIHLDVEIREEAVDWILKVTAHYNFKTLTAILGINYLDRFLLSISFRRESPWMVQLVAVTCLSLAAKVEETQVPLLLDLQVVETKYVFEAKIIQRMELLILSTLEWRMHPVTPISFLDHIIRRLGLRTNLHWDFLKRCECLLLSLVSDSRFVGYLPSVLATATMMHVIDQVELFNPLHYQNQLLDVLKTSKDKVDKCYDQIQNPSEKQVNKMNRFKRKFSYDSMPNSPSCVMDSDLFASDSSNESWASTHCSSGSNSSATGPPLKKMREQDGKPKSIRLTVSLSRAIVASP